MKKTRIQIGIALVLHVSFASRVSAQDANADKAPSLTIIENVVVFDGLNEKTITGSVLIEDNLIKEVGAEVKAPEGAVVIDGKGKFLMPGLADMHVHTATFGPVQTHSRDMLHPYAHGALAADRAEGMLMNGFTTIRDLGGPASYLRKIIDARVLPGPRIYPTENWISTTSGHGDFRELNDPHPNIDGGRRHFYDDYVTIIADGRDEHMRAAREAFRRGATQLKIFTGGGITSLFDPLHSGPTADEVQAVVEVAEDWDTYVAVHAHTKEALQLAIDNGIKSIEHAPWLTDEQAKIMIEKDLVLSTSFSPVFDISVEQARKAYPPESFEKWIKVREAASNLLEVIKNNPELKIVVASDHIPQWNNGRSYDDKALREFEYFSKAIGNFRTLVAFTSAAGEVNAMTGKMNPYPKGPLGVIKPGAYADLLIVDGNPLENIEVMMDADKNFKLIMKDGLIYKNTLLLDSISEEQWRKVRAVVPRMYGDYNAIPEE